MTRGFTTAEYLTDTHEHSGTVLRSKCKRVGAYCFGFCLLVGSYGAFFVLGYQYSQSQSCSSDTGLLEEI